MRPVRRNSSPQAHDFDDYKDAKPYLVARLGAYCSYCERPVSTLLAVEHVQPKDLRPYEHLIGCWSNFLLACVNCNSTKKNKDVVLAQVLLPDRDNTFHAYTYLPDGTVEESSAATDAGLGHVALATLQLTGLDRDAVNTPDENGKQVALDRVSQRMEAWLWAIDTKSTVRSSPGNAAVIDLAIKVAVKTGFFSVWMTVFSDMPDMLVRLVAAFPGTSASGCFHDLDGRAVCPSPNPDVLTSGGKI